jgi:hypothetical protein
MRKLFAKILALFFLLLPTSITASDDDPFNITFYGSFLHTKDVPSALFFFRPIKEFDMFELRRALRNHQIDIVVLGSDGGDVWEGLRMAGIIYDKGIATYVPEFPELPNEMGCYSACAYMFFGGKIRNAKGVLAVHQMGYYGSDRDQSKEKVSDVQQGTQFTVSEIIGFLNEFETPPFVYERMFRSRAFYEFDDDEKEKLSSRGDEISLEKIARIDSFIRDYFSYLQELIKAEEEATQSKAAEVSEEENLKLAVAEIQKLLNEAGCNAGVADGVWGRKTQAAAVLFAKTARLPFEDEELISDQFIESLKKAPSNFCPKAPQTSVSVISYSLECSGWSTGVIRINMASGKSFGSFTGVKQNKTFSGKFFKFKTVYPTMRIDGLNEQIDVIAFWKNGRLPEKIWIRGYGEWSCNAYR